MNRGKRFIRYFLFTILALVFLFWGANYGFVLKKQAQNIYYYYFFSALFPIIYGIILALPKLFKEKYKNGCWSIDWIKFLAIGTPTILIDLSLVLVALTPIGHTNYFSTLNPFIEILILDRMVISLSGIIFGYILITSFKRR
jgi:hypothetical protein